jgi:hypothetical protein
MKKDQREIQNMRLREIKAKRRADGLCVTCAKPSRPGKCQCQECSDAGKARYRIATGKAPLPAKKKPCTRLTGGVTRQTNRDGYGRPDDYYVASIMIRGKAMARRWSIQKHGEAGAKLAASLQKLLWVVENGLWNPADGDPLAIMSYAESFNGNRDYDDCEISDVSSPWIQEYEDVA